MSVLVTGASGQVGGRVARVLAASGHRVRVLLRDPRHAVPPGVDVAVGDYGDPASLAAAFAGVRAVFMVCLAEAAPERLRKHDNVVVAARAARVEHLVYLSFLSASPTAGFPQGRWHAHTEAAIDAAGVPRTFLRTGLFRSSLATTAGVRRDGLLLAPAGAGRIAPVAREDVADAAVAVLTGTGHIGATYDLTGPALLDWHGVAASLSTETQVLRYRDVPPARFAEMLAASGVPPVLVEGMSGLFADVRAGRLAVATDAVPSLTGRSTAGPASRR